MTTDPNEFDIHPLQTWRRLSPAERVMLLAVTIALFGFASWFIWFVASASL